MIKNQTYSKTNELLPLRNRRNKTKGYSGSLSLQNAIASPSKRSCTFLLLLTQCIAYSKPYRMKTQWILLFVINHLDISSLFSLFFNPLENFFCIHSPISTVVSSFTESESKPNKKYLPCPLVYSSFTWTT